MVRIGLMPKRIFHVCRREFLAGLGAVAFVPARLRTAAAEAPQPWLLEAKAATISLRPGPATPVWSLQSPNQALRFKRGSQLEVILQNQLPVPVMLDWRGLDGAPAAEPLTSLPPLAPGAKASFAILLRHAGTFFCGLRLLGDGAELPARPLAFVVAENEPISVDRDEVFLVEDWRLRADGTAIAPGIDPKDAVALLTVNGHINPDIAVRSNERLRFRFVNGCQHQVIAIKIEDQDVTVMALDGAPAEPFLARNGALVLAPGGRADAFIDASAAPGAAVQILLHDGSAARPIARLVTSTEPPVRPARLPTAPALPSDGLPAQLDLRSALRVDLVLAGPEWANPAHFAISAAPAFQAKAGRIVVLALANRADRTAVFHLHGHHFRLLDRLDDGWKPFWLDTLAVEPGQTQHIAFAAENAGRWLLESVGTDWTAPRLVRWYGVV
jgi:FtsP/CotA-like multicopper oxidase with cupredoxin domain